jgi:hypothetical protein
MGKVRYVNWSPADWLAGTRGLLTMRQLAVYDTVLNLIYDRGGPAPNDPAFIAGHFKADNHETSPSVVKATRRAVDCLVKLGKLKVSTDGEWLTNGRAHEELDRATSRIDNATKAGRASGAARRLSPTSPLPSPPPLPLLSPLSQLSNSKRLSRTGVERIKSHEQESESHNQNLTVAARARELTPAGLAPAHDVEPASPEDLAARRDQMIRDLGFEPGDVATPPPPRGDDVPPAQRQTEPGYYRKPAALGDLAAAARRKLMGGG